ncbi:MAG: hypothetical protein IH624_18285 [Phycisphaerae bacterium]|nr:hypothetical protein [Phycisphaerae bacterium]
MATEKQILANRRNAQKSTGPRTRKGKAAVAQNAFKHGLFTEKVLIKGEDPADFDRHRRTLLAGLKPLGPLETLLAERVVALSWRLLRTGRIQAEAIDTLNPDLNPPIPCYAPGRYPIPEFDPAKAPPLGRTIVRDFMRDNVLDRLLAYEHKMEQSLYKACVELEKLQLRRDRQTAAPGETYRKTLPLHIERICEDPHLEKQTQFQQSPEAVSA